MKWLENIIRKIVLKEIEVYNDSMMRYCEEIESIGILTKIIKTELSSFRDEFSDFRRKVNDEIFLLKQADGDNYLKVLNELNEWKGRIVDTTTSKNKLLEQEFNDVITGLTKHIDRQVELLGGKRGIVVDLLKKIAVLEGQVEDKNASK